MIKQFMINLPVSSLKASKDFYTAIGFTYNPAMSDDQATCFNLNDDIVVTLLPQAEFKRAIGENKVADSPTNEALLAIAVESRRAVDDFAEKAIAAGGKELYDPTDLPGIYGRTLKDPDNHLWNAYFAKD